MRITVSGPPGSGTTSLSKHLSEKFSFKLISAGEIFRSLAAERGMSLIEFGNLCQNDPSIDGLIDKRQKDTGESGDDIIIEGRLAGHMIENATLRIWIAASAECRTQRIADRESVDFEASKAETIAREQSETERYRKYYGIDIDDLSIYDLVINSERWGMEELASIVTTAIEKIKS